MRKKIMAVVLSCLTFLTLVFSSFAVPLRASAVSVDEMTQVAVEIITRNEGTYGSINRNDNGAVSIGILQWHATRALQLMRSIANADTASAQSILGSAFYNEVMTASSWNTRTFSVAEGTAASNLLTTSVGKSKQDALAFSDVQGYINAGKQYGLTNAGVLVYFAELYNRGSGVAARILSAAKGSGSYADITLATLHNAALTDRGNSSGYYTSRLNDAYNTVISLGWGDASVTEGTTAQPSTPDTSDFSESYAGTYTVTASSLNIRSAPTTSASKIGSIPNGATVTVSSGNGSWAAVSYNGVNGYCSMDYLKAAAAQTTAPAATTTAVTTTTTTTTTEAVTTTTTTTTTTTAAAETTAAPSQTTTAETTAATVQSSVAVVGVADPTYASIYGDVNCDGKVDAADAVLLQKYLNGCVFLNYTQLSNADCQRDNVLDATDVTVIMQYLIDNLIAIPVV